MQDLAHGLICHEATTLEKPDLRVTLTTVEEAMAVVMTTVEETTAAIMTTAIIDNRKS
jgi:hypothetical protein